MLLTGDGADAAGRAFVERHLLAHADNPLPHAGDLLIYAPDTDTLLASLPYDAGAVETYDTLVRVLRDHPRFAPASADWDRPWSWAGTGAGHSELEQVYRFIRGVDQNTDISKEKVPRFLEKAAARLEWWLQRFGPQNPDGTARALVLLGAYRSRLADADGARAAWQAVIDDHPHHPLRHRAYYNLLDHETWPTATMPEVGELPRSASTPSARPERDQHVAALSDPQRYHQSRTGLAFARIPAGTFTMGGTPPWYEREKPHRSVTLTRDYWMSATVVTRAQYRRFRPDAVPADPHPLADDLPVTYVTYVEALEYCAWLSEQEGRTVRLPTEAEWERAARGGIEGAPYPWGFEPITPERANYRERRPVPVASYAPNPYGLFDMVGNVLEWTADYHADDTYTRFGPAVTDPTGPAGPLNPDEHRRIVRGGMCGDDVCQVFCRNGYRLGAWEQWEGGVVGLRLVMETADPCD